MDRDAERLNLLAIFRYVIAGLAALFSFFPLAGRSLALRKRYSFEVAITCVECLFVPFETIRGVFPIIALSRGSVKALFEVTQTTGLDLHSLTGDLRRRR